MFNTAPLMFAQLIKNLDSTGCPVCGYTQSGCSLWDNGVLCRKESRPRVDEWVAQHEVNGWILYASKKVNRQQQLTEELGCVTPQQSNDGNKTKKLKQKMGVPILQKQRVLARAFKAPLTSKMVEFVKDRHPDIDLRWFGNLAGQSERLASVGLAKRGSDFALGQRVAIGIRDLDGQLVGAQLRALDGAGERYGKYIWLSGGAYRNHNQEPPLQVVPAGTNTDTVVFCEGVLKPIVLSTKIKASSIIVGAVGGQFAASETTLKTLLETFIVSGATRFLLGCDAGWENNPDIVRAYKRLEGICSDMGVGLQYVTTEEGLDCDEVTDATAAKLFGGNSPDILALATELTNRHTQAQLQSLGQEAVLDGVLPIGSPVQVGPIIANSDSKWFLDRSEVGSGKSFAMESHVQFFDRVIYISKSHRNLPTKWLVENSWPTPSRHGGLVESTTQKDGAGKPVLRRAKQGETPTTNASCDNAQWHQALVKSGVESQAACQSCPFYAACTEGGSWETDSNYLYLRNLGNVENKRVIATTLRGFTKSLIGRDSGRTLVVVDEAEDLLVKTAEIRLNTHVLGALQETLGNDCIESFEGTKIDPGTGKDLPVNLVRLRPNLVESAMNYAEKQQRIEIQRAKRWTPKQNRPRPVLNNWTEQVRIMSRGWEPSGLYPSVTEVAPEVSNFVGLVNESPNVQVLLADATTDPRILAPFLGLSLGDLVVMSTPPSPKDHVEIIGVRYDGFQTNDRQGTQARTYTKRFLDRVEAIHGKGNVGFVGPLSECRDRESLGFFSGSRGSNQFQSKKALVVSGSPKLNLGCLAKEYQLIQADTPLSFGQYCQQRNRAELDQVFGRIRATRRTDESLTIYLLGHFDLSSYSALGYKTSTQWPESWDEDLCDVRRRSVFGTIYRALQVLSMDNLVTQKSLAEQMERSAASLCRTLKNLRMSLKYLKEAVVSVLQARVVPVLWAELTEEEVEIVREFPEETWEDEIWKIPQEHRTRFLKVMLPHLLCVGCRGFKKQEWEFLKRTALSTLYAGVHYKPGATDDNLHPSVWAITAEKLFHDSRLSLGF